MMRRKVVSILNAVALCGLMSACELESEDNIGISAQESHSWGSYHWARSTASFDLPTVDSVTADWDIYFDAAISDWSASTVVNLTDGGANDSKKIRRRCNAANGTIRVCNLSYGNTGWLGIAGISIGSDGHITKGYTKLNDTYLGTGAYTDPAWKYLVMCQEIGHDLGLDHQDEDFTNTPLGTCMDYSSDPVPNQHPDAHDYEQLETMYTHLDDPPDDGGGGGSCNAPPGKGCNKGVLPGWGRSLGRRGNTETFVKEHPTNGTAEVTHVIWAAE